LQGLLAAMPLTLADGLGTDMERLRRFRTLLSTTAANIAPVQGEYLGGPVPHLLFVGRRGQPFYLVAVRERRGQPQCRDLRQVGLGQVGRCSRRWCAALRGAARKLS
jgi:conjugal transfer ATP-binding protein TraC